MALINIRPAVATDIPRLMVTNHTCQSDYVWQLELRRELNQVTANFREVRLPRAVDVMYPRNPLSLGEDWTRRDLVLVATQKDNPVGYLCAKLESASGIGWITDLVTAPDVRRQGTASALITASQTWALERQVRRIILETQSKNQACIRLAQKSGFEFCGYNDQYYPTQDVALFFGRAIK